MLFPSRPRSTPSASFLNEDWLEHIRTDIFFFHLLPVDHPALSALHQTSLLPQPLLIEYDVDNLSSAREVEFICRSCRYHLTNKPIRNFVEIPSANWREVADNWFGACCCSFEGISEKLVTRYVNSHTCAQGMLSGRPEQPSLSSFLVKLPYIK
ncbi:unnamed protein product [Lathyrus sativus]|nr:unnamed protein product [Lathyrus sativus]